VIGVPSCVTHVFLGLGFAHSTICAIIGQISSFDHAPCHVHDGLILSFGHSILLWSIFGGELPFKSMLSTIICKLL
jgi:hypothetical protein